MGSSCQVSHMFKKRNTPSQQSGSNSDRPRVRYSERDTRQFDRAPRGTSFSYQSRGASDQSEQLRGSKPRLRATESLAVSQARSRTARLKSLAQHIPGILAVGLLVVSVVYNLGVSTDPRIQINGSVAAHSTEQQAEYERIVQQAFERLPVTSRTKLTFDSDGLGALLQKNHPELGGVRISLPFFGQRPVVHLETPPRSFVYTNARSETAVLDSNGRVLALGAASDLPRISDTASLEMAVGKQVLPSDEAAFMKLVYDELQRSGVQVESFALPAVPKRLEVKLKDTPYFVKMTMQQGAAEQAGAYLATRESLQKQGATPAEYVDVRVSGRIFYK